MSQNVQPRSESLSALTGFTFDDPLRAACPATCPRLPDEARIGLRHRFVRANGLRFHVVEAGPEDGPLVLLLHGFPEFWYSWRAQIGVLAERFRVVAPDLRGYNLSDKPAAGYDVETLASDVAALIQALGTERAHVVGHDWGGMIAWSAAIFHPKAVQRLAVLNAPHPAAFAREISRNPAQMLRSWYIALFQVPVLAEWLLTHGQARGIADVFKSSTLKPEAFSAADLAAYRRAMLRPGAARATLAYYRALWRTPRDELLAKLEPVSAPTLLIWGVKDTALVPELTDGLDAWVPDLHLARIPEASHWVQHEQPVTVNQLLLEHLGG
ncbi:MAG: alpha/beta fold hydrolase [Chloroflexota bacterium]